LCSFAGVRNSGPDNGDAVTDLPATRDADAAPVSLETRKRSVFKSITWRILASCTTILLVFTFTGELALSFGVGVIEVILKLFLYFLHERAWTRVRWGMSHREAIEELKNLGISETQFLNSRTRFWAAWLLVAGGPAVFML